MSTRQAEDILKHTFKQLEKMLDDVRRQEKLSRRKPVARAKSGRKNEADDAAAKKT